MRYAKPALSVDAQIALLQRRGMVIEDPGAARHALQHVNYYRLRAYWLPFEAADAEDGSHAFEPGTRFEAVLAFYAFEQQGLLTPMCPLKRLLSA